MRMLLLRKGCVQMKISYSVLYILLILTLTCCTVIAKRSARQCRGAVAWLDTSLILPIIGNLIVILSNSAAMARFGYYLYFVGIDLVLLSLVNFTNSYCQGVGDGSHKPTVIYFLLGADVVQILLNLVFGHAFDVMMETTEKDTHFILVSYWGQTVHRIIGYLVLLCVMLIFTLAAVRTPRIHKERYTVLLASMVAIGLMQAYYIFSHSTYDRSVIGYGLFGLVIFYFAICYRPLRLLDSMLSNIVSDLSDAFYIFDSNGKCIWANEQGCKLVDLTGTNYEEINSKLIRIFGDPADSSGSIPKKSVGEGEKIRFYTLEEKQVKDSRGNPNGTYLRIQDVTEEEHEIQVRDKQIGQISQEAYKDPLTGVGSKAAYDNKVMELNEQLENGLTEFALVMVDMNNLKQINDEFGHKAGDLYIKGCCHLICEAFKHSPVFRIGGDEFVVILRGADYDARLQTVEDLRMAYDEAYERADTDPWLCYSAAVGMAEHASDDSTFELVFKRADEAMYKEKKLFKVLHGSYR